MYRWAAGSRECERAANRAIKAQYSVHGCRPLGCSLLAARSTRLLTAPLPRAPSYCSHRTDGCTNCTAAHSTDAGSSPSPHRHTISSFAPDRPIQHGYDVTNGRRSAVNCSAALLQVLDCAMQSAATQVDTHKQVRLDSLVPRRPTLSPSFTYSCTSIALLQAPPVHVVVPLWHDQMQHRPPASVAMWSPTTSCRQVQLQRTETGYWYSRSCYHGEDTARACLPSSLLLPARRPLQASHSLDASLAVCAHTSKLAHPSLHAACLPSHSTHHPHPLLHRNPLSHSLLPSVHLHCSCVAHTSLLRCRDTAIRGPCCRCHRTPSISRPSLG